MWIAWMSARAWAYKNNGNIGARMPAKPRLSIQRCKSDTPAVVVSTSLLLLALSSVTLPGFAAAYEPDVQSFSARQAFPEKWLRSKDYKVDMDVINQDYMNHYRINSRFGVFRAVGNGQLFVRIREIEALAQLEEMSKSRVFVNSVGETVTSTVENLSRAADDPATAADDFESGFVRLMKRVGRMTKNAFNKGKAILAKDKSDAERSEELADSGTNMAKGVLGVNRAYRELARDLRVDPYSRNSLLRNEMENMANYAAAGSLGVKTIVPVLPMLYGAAYLITVSNLVWNTHPIDLQLQNEAALRDMGISDKWIQRLFENDRHTLTTQTRIVSSLERLKNVKGRKILVEYAARVDRTGDALFYTRMIELLAMYHQRRGSIEKVVATKRTPFVLTRNKRAVAMMPVDYLRWTRSAAGLARYLKGQISRYPVHLEIWVNGKVTPRARLELGRAGWAVFDQAGRRL